MDFSPQYEQLLERIIRRRIVSLEQLCETRPTDINIFQSHLNRSWIVITTPFGGGLLLRASGSRWEFWCEKINAEYCKQSTLRSLYKEMNLILPEDVDQFVMYFGTFEF